MLTLSHCLLEITVMKSDTMVMTGTNNMFRKKWLINWTNHIAIKVLKPVSAEEVAAKEVKEIMQQTQERMTTALAELREKVKNEKK